VGSDPSPVLEKYPPKSYPSSGVPLAARTTPSTPSAVQSTAKADAVPTEGAKPTPVSLIALEPPFDVDSFAQLLGSNSIRVEVPREDLPEVLRRIVDFMGFGIYVYSFSVRPAAEESLKKFVVELRRVDFSAGDGDWKPFEDKGVADSPFGPRGST
jgi:hypothetical protein